MTQGTDYAASSLFVNWRVGPSTILILGFAGGSVVKKLPANAENSDLISGSGRSLEKEMATHSSILAWENPWTEEPGGLQPMGYKRVGHHLPTKQRQILISIPSAFTKNNNKTLKCFYFLSYKLCKCWNTIASLLYAKCACIGLKSSLNFSFLRFLPFLWHYFCKIKPMGKKKSTKWHCGEKPVVAGKTCLPKVFLKTDRLSIHLWSCLLFPVKRGK